MYVIRGNMPLFIETPLWPDAKPMRHSLAVPDHEAVDTGLITATGEPIMRVPNPLGFHRPRPKNNKNNSVEV